MAQITLTNRIRTAEPTDPGWQELARRVVEAFRAIPGGPWDVTLEADREPGLIIVGVKYESGAMGFANIHHDDRLDAIYRKLSCFVTPPFLDAEEERSERECHAAADAAGAGEDAAKPDPRKTA